MVTRRACCRYSTLYNKFVAVFHRRCFNSIFQRFPCVAAAWYDSRHLFQDEVGAVMYELPRSRRILIGYFKPVRIRADVYAGSIYGCNACRIIVRRYSCDDVRARKRRRYSQLCVFRRDIRNIGILFQKYVVRFVDLCVTCYIECAAAFKINGRTFAVRRSVAGDHAAGFDNKAAVYSDIYRASQFVSAGYGTIFNIRIRHFA